jgi:hypothetical protein
MRLQRLGHALAAAPQRGVNRQLLLGGRVRDQPAHQRADGRDLDWHRPVGAHDRGHLDDRLVGQERQDW